MLQPSSLHGPWGECQTVHGVARRGRQPGTVGIATSGSHSPGRDALQAEPVTCGLSTSCGQEDGVEDAEEG